MRHTEGVGKKAASSRLGDRFGSREGEFAGKGIGLGALRRSRGVTQVELAGPLGMPQDQVSKLEARNDVKLSSLIKYLEALGADDNEIAASFLGGDRRSLPLHDLSLRAVRRSRGATQTELADFLGIAQGAVSRLEAPSRDLRLSTLLKYLEGLGANNVELVAGFEGGESATVPLRSRS